MGEDECGFGEFADAARAYGDPLKDAPAAGEQGESAFAAAAGRAQQRVVGLVVRGEDLAAGGLLDRRLDSVTGAVVAPDYLHAPFAIQARLLPMTVRVEPYPVPIGRPTSVTVFAEDADTRAPVAGEVRINNRPVAATNTPFRYTFRCRRVGRPPEVDVVCPEGAVLAPTYEPRSIDFGI